MIHKIGLTGGIAAGKSEVAALLRDRGLIVVNLDEVGRKVSLDPKVIVDINEICGLSGDNLDRAKVRAIVFSDDAIRKKVEQRLHPVILAEFEREMAEAEKGGHRVIVCEAALLVESGYQKHLDELIVVTAAEAQRKNRLIARDNIDAELADKILAAQTKDDVKLKVASYVLKNDTSREVLAARVDELLEIWRGKGYLDRVH